jgi:hypothetical protein
MDVDITEEQRELQRRARRPAEAIARDSAGPRVSLPLVP